MKRYSNNPNGVMMAVLGMSVAAMGCELRFRRLKPLTWIFGEKCWHDAYGYVWFGGGGIHFARPRRCGGGAAAVRRRRRLLKRVCLCAKNL
jgi:hypothetical protein